MSSDTTSTPSVTSEQVVASLKGERWLEPWLLAVLQPTAERLPTILADMLGETLTVTTLIRARLRVLNDYATVGDYVTWVGQLPGLSPEWVREALDDATRNYINWLRDVEATLRVNNLTEETVLYGGKPGAGTLLTAMLKAGPVTIGQVMALQPSYLLLV